MQFMDEQSFIWEPINCVCHMTIVGFMQKFEERLVIVYVYLWLWAVPYDCTNIMSTYMTSL